VQRRDYFHSLQFEQDLVLDNHIGALAAIEPHTVIVQREIDLPYVGQAVALEFKGKAPFVNTLKQTRPETRMHPHRQPDDPSCQVAVMNKRHSGMVADLS
jgi:hypothetical protein